MKAPTKTSSDKKDNTLTPSNGQKKITITLDIPSSPPPPLDKKVPPPDPALGCVRKGFKIIGGLGLLIANISIAANAGVAAACMFTALLTLPLSYYLLPRTKKVRTLRYIGGGILLVLLLMYGYMYPIAIAFYWFIVHWCDLLAEHIQKKGHSSDDDYMYYHYLHQQNEEHNNKGDT